MIRFYKFIMETKEKIFAGILTLIALLGMYVIFVFYGNMRGNVDRISEASLPAVSRGLDVKTAPVPATPDAVVDDILNQASADSSELDDASSSVDAILQEDRSSVDNFDKVYDSNEL